MLNIPIQSIPRQTFFAPLDSNEWEITLIDANGAISCSIAINGVSVIENTRVVANTRIIPSKYEEQGNLFMATQDQAIPDYTQFGTTQLLYYVSAAELAIIRAPEPVRITASDFDANGALPLRFSPQGYTLS